MRLRAATFWTLALIAFAACGTQKVTVEPAGGAPGAAGGAAGNAGGAGGAASGAGGAPATCPPPASTECGPSAPSFATTISPILDRSCNSCHTADNPDGVWPLDAWADVAAWSNLIIADLLHCTMPPPDSNTPFPEADRQLIFAWLACGSPNN